MKLPTLELFTSEYTVLHPWDSYRDAMFLCFMYKGLWESGDLKQPLPHDQCVRPEPLYVMANVGGNTTQILLRGIANWIRDRCEIQRSNDISLRTRLGVLSNLDDVGRVVNPIIPMLL